MGTYECHTFSRQWKPHRAAGAQVSTRCAAHKVRPASNIFPVLDIRSTQTAPIPDTWPKSQMDAPTACGPELAAASLQHQQWAPLSPTGSSQPRTELLTPLLTQLLTLHWSASSHHLRHALQDVLRETVAHRVPKVRKSLLGLIPVNEQGSCTETSDAGRVLLVGRLDQGFTLEYTCWPQESRWDASSRTWGLSKEETSCFFSTQMIFVDMPLR